VTCTDCGTHATVQELIDDEGCGCEPADAGSSRTATRSCDVDMSVTRTRQGGATGYAGREWVATPTLDASVRLPMGYAWNPTVQGVKSEDTVLVTEEGFEPLTTTGEWPTRTAAAVGTDVERKRHDVRRL
jgi:hypothetical protein